MVQPPISFIPSISDNIQLLTPVPKQYIGLLNILEVFPLFLRGCQDPDVETPFVDTAVGAALVHSTSKRFKVKLKKRQGEYHHNLKLIHQIVI